MATVEQVIEEIESLGSLIEGPHELPAYLASLIRRIVSIRFEDFDVRSIERIAVLASSGNTVVKKLLDNAYQTDRSEWIHWSITAASKSLEQIAIQSSELCGTGGITEKAVSVSTEPAPFPGMKVTREADWNATGFETTRSPRRTAARFPNSSQPEAMDAKPSDHEISKIEADPAAVFVVHGRNHSARDAMFTLLRAFGLSPIEWEEAISLTKKGSPYIGEILEAGLQRAQAVVVLLTGDEESRLRKHFASGDEGETFLVQPRMNVIFEAGMSLGLRPERTILVEIGETRSFSDIAGRHAVRFTTDSPEPRGDLAKRLKTIGCSVQFDGNDWMTAGDFQTAIDLGRPWMSSDSRVTEDEPASGQLRRSEDGSSEHANPDEPEGPQQKWSGAFVSFRRRLDHDRGNSRDGVYFVIGNYGTSSLLNVRVQFIDPLISSSYVEISSSGPFSTSLPLLKPGQEVELFYDHADELALQWFLREITDAYRVEVTSTSALTGEESTVPFVAELSTVFTGERAGPWMSEDGSILNSDHEVVQAEIDPHPMNRNQLN